MKKAVLDDAGRQVMREHECWSCSPKHVWTAPVILSDASTNVSGEATVYCPVCFKRASCASVPFVIVDGERKPLA